MANENDYDGGEIKILEGLEAVRKRPGMYIGSTSAAVCITWCTRSWTTPSTRPWPVTAPHQGDVHADNSITVVDNGRGIPVDIHPRKRCPPFRSS